MAADSATLYTEAYASCTVALAAPTSSCAAKDYALQDERLARFRSDSIASVQASGKQRADSALAVAVDALNRHNRSRVAKVIPCPSRAQSAVIAAIVTHGVLKGGSARRT